MANHRAIYLAPFAIAAGAAATLAPSTSAIGQAKQAVTGPVAVYWLTADTVSGLGVGMGGLSVGAIMSGASANGAAQRSLNFYLGSTNRPPGVGPEANHLPPAATQVGPSLPLLSPEKSRERIIETQPERSERQDDPTGRLLVYWGCGERARPGQPVIIDYSKPGAKPADALPGQMFKELEPPGAERWASFGEWPNRKSNNKIPLSASLVGEHVIRANYAPEIRFTLGASQDFLAPLMPQRTKLAEGGLMLQWPAIANSRAYFAAVSGGNNGDTILWSSSENRMMALGIPPYMGSVEITRLLANQTLLGPQQTKCAIPAEVIKATEGSGMLMMNAFGQEADFAFPARPANPAVPWNIQWTAKALTKATYMGMLADPRGNSEESEEITPENHDGEAIATPHKKKKRSVLEGLGGILFR